MDSSGNTSQATSQQGEGVSSQAEGTQGEATGAAQESAVQDPSKETEQTDYRAKYRNRFKESNPDLDTEDNDSFYKYADEHYTKMNDEHKNLSDYQKKNQEMNKAMLDTFDSSPELAGLVKDVMKGAPLHIAIARNMDIDSIKPIEGDTDEAAWKEAVEGRKKTKADKEAYLKSIDDNINMSVGEIRAFAKENNLEQEAMNTILNQYDEIIKDSITGKTSKTLLNALKTAITADQEKADAVEQATVATKNEKIEAIKAKSTEGDNLPKMQNTATEQDAIKAPVDKWAEAVDEQEKKRKR